VIPVDGQPIISMHKRTTIWSLASIASLWTAIYAKVWSFNFNLPAKVVRQLDV
jgi:hypothetical protein